MPVLFLIGDKSDYSPFTEDDIEFLTVLSSDVVMAIQNAKLFEDIKNQLDVNKRLLFSTVETLATAIDIKNSYTHGHTERVMKYSLTLLKYIPQHLIKDNFEQYEDSILNEKFIIYVKPLILKSVYSIKIKKNSNYKIKINNNKINNQIDIDINKMFSDFLIIDFNNKTQIDFFYKIIDILFNYSLLEHFIDTSMNLLNK